MHDCEQIRKHRLALGPGNAREKSLSGELSILG
jgi:hypothetical protein